MGKSVQKGLKLRGLKAAVLTKFKRFKLIIGRLHYDVKRAKIPGSCSKVRAKQRRTNNADCVLFCLRLAELL